MHYNTISITKVEFICGCFSIHECFYFLNQLSQTQLQKMHYLNHFNAVIYYPSSRHVDLFFSLISFFVIEEMFSETAIYNCTH